MTTRNINSVISVLPVENFDEVLNWYQRLIGREADVIPMEGVAEWSILDNAWIQVATDPENSGRATVIIGVNEVEEQRKALWDADISVSETIEYPGIVKMIEVLDPDGNMISFVQDISGNSVA